MGEYRVGGQMQLGGVGIVVLVLILLGAGVCYRLGLISTLGYESHTLKNEGNCFSGTKGGTKIGFKMLYLFEGQTLAVDYKAKIDAGGLTIRMFPMSDPMNADSDHRLAIRDSDTGSVAFPVRANGLYKLVIEPTSLGLQRAGTCYAMEYTVMWGLG